jgi:nucleoside-diphosphate-sugar epimerase
VAEDFVGVTFRPATVCGWSPRQRLDLIANIFTNQALKDRPITVFGGEQLRPSVHIQDYCDAVELLMTAPSDKVNGEMFNVGYQNHSALRIAQMVAKTVIEEFPDKRDTIKIEISPSNDKRSYHINSDKIARVLGFKPRYTLADGVRELCQAFRRGELSHKDDRYVNVDRLRRLKAA